MISKSAFNTAAQIIIDQWVDAASPIVDPQSLYKPILAKLTFKMSLNLVDTSGGDPLDWEYRRIKNHGFKTRVLSFKKWFPEGKLRDLPDQGYVKEAIIPHYDRIIGIGKPIIDLVQTTVGGINVGYDRLIIPQKSSGKPRWCLSVTEGRFMFAAPKVTNLDLIDEEIVQLLIEGESAKEIAPILSLSQRTIEHRIDKMKTRFEARNVVHLTAKLFAFHMDRRMDEARRTLEEIP